jgi:hypothetical protein
VWMLQVSVIAGCEAMGTERPVRNSDVTLVRTCQWRTLNVGDVGVVIA